MTAVIPASHKWCFKHRPALPKPLCLVVQGPSEASGLVVVELRDELRVLHLVWVGSKFHCDRLRGSWGFLAI